jgi:hypothetical protein
MMQLEQAVSLIDNRRVEVYIYKPYPSLFALLKKATPKNGRWKILRAVCHRPDQQSAHQFAYQRKTKAACFETVPGDLGSLRALLTIDLSGAGNRNLPGRRSVPTPNNPIGISDLFLSTVRKQLSKLGAPETQGNRPSVGNGILALCTMLIFGCPTVHIINLKFRPKYLKIWLL